jgi:DMSO/TMAO reductase YedYZ molybdopterin-dependent catalytic subunit
MSFISRGFSGRRRPDADPARIPPGQYVTDDFPVLSAGPTPRADLSKWTFVLDFGSKVLAQWSWNEFEGLPQTDVTVDIHCVTSWSKFDTAWRGVSIDGLFKAAGLDEAPAPFAMIHCDGGYTTNVPVKDLVAGKAMIATRYRGEPIPAEHGGPARLLVPHLYFWKSAKWARRIEFIKQDTPGFWESLGYNMYGDPFKEQRYAGD